MGRYSRVKELARKGKAKPSLNGHVPGNAEPKGDEPPSSRSKADLVGLADLESLGAKLDWIWQLWIQRAALTLVSADAGVGKTRFMADLVRRIRHKETWPDGTAIGLACDAPVIWVAADHQFPELGQLHKDFDLKGGVYLNSYKDDPLAGTSLDADEDIGALWERIEIAGAQLVVVDTLGNCTDADLCRQEEAKRLAVPLMRLATVKNISILLLYHANKEGKPLGRRMPERCRTVIQLSKPDGAADGVFDLKVGKTFAVFPTPLRAEMRDNRIDYAPGEPTGAIPSPARQQAGRPPSEVHRAAEWIVQRLQAEGRLRTSRLATIAADDAGIAERTVWRARDHLVRQGQVVETTEKPKWLSLPETASDDTAHDDEGKVPF
jgi:hypothetical protein